MIKVTLSVLILGVALFTAPSVGFKPTQKQEAEASGEDVLFNTTLLGRARKAKAKGINKVAFPGPHGIPMYVRNWDEVLSNFSIIVAEPVSKTSVLLDPHHIATFYKVKVIENLLRKDRDGCCGAPTGVPGGLPAPGENEMYVVLNGGTVTLDGVEVSQTGLFSSVQMSEPYLLFLSSGASGQVGSIPLGHRGIFKVGADGRLEAIDGGPNNIKTYLDNLYGSSLGELRSGLKRHSISK